jgi:hypothetical protein
MNWLVVPPLGGLETRSSEEDRLKAGLRTASRPIYASALSSADRAIAVPERGGADAGGRLNAASALLEVLYGR